MMPHLYLLVIVNSARGFAESTTAFQSPWRSPITPPYTLLPDFGGVGDTLLQLPLWDQWNLGAAMLLENIRVVMGELL